ncbi:unnamed protein product [Victoria cruziana]
MCRGREQPCLCCHPRSYIRMVQHLIERCLIFRMSRDDCVQALSRHAGIEPLVTLTVWKELIKANQEFFQTYTSQTSAVCKRFHMKSRLRQRRQWSRNLTKDDGSWSGTPRLRR